MIGQNINSYFETAMMYPLERLQAVLRGQDKSIPAAAAMMALPLKERQVAAAGGMQAAQQPQQPTVREKMAQPMMAQMPQGMPQGNQQQVAALPENTGVMGLPAPNMNKMADGGIVAFAGDDGSLVGDDTSSPLGRWWDSMTQQDVFREQYLKQQEALKAQRDVIDQGGLFGLKQQTPEQQAKYEEARKKAYPVQTKAEKPAGPTTFTPPAAKEDAVTAALKTYGTSSAEKKKAPGIAGIPKPPTAPTGPMSYEESLKKVGAGDKELLGEYAKAGKEETAGMEALLAEKEAAKPKGKAGESLEKYLKGKEAADVNKRAENINNAFVNAGFTIATSDSPSLLTNLAKGGKEGMALYKAGIDKLDAAADERARMFASIEDARRAEDKGDWKALYEAKADIKKSEAAYRKYGIDALVKLTGENRKVAADMFNTATTNEARLQQTALAGQYELQKADKMAAAYGAKTNPADKAIDNAAKALQTWKDSQEGKLAQARDPSAYARRERELMTQHFKMMGLPDPYGQNALSGNVFNDPKEQAAFNKYTS